MFPLCDKVRGDLSQKLYAEAKKWKFHRDSVYFLGYLCTQGQIKMNQQKVQTIVDLPMPGRRKNNDLYDLPTSIKSLLETSVLSLLPSML